jgi:hypothetical protein
MMAISNTPILIGFLIFILAYVTFKLDEEQYLLKLFMFFFTFFSLISGANLVLQMGIDEGLAANTLNAMENFYSLFLFLGIAAIGIFMLYYLYVVFIWIGCACSGSFKKWAINKGMTS